MKKMRNEDNLSGLTIYSKLNGKRHHTIFSANPFQDSIGLTDRTIIFDRGKFTFDLL